MNALQQDRSPRRRAPGAKPLLVGALACGALLVTAPGAMANHVMANGMLCPHASEPVPGGGPATVNPSAAPNTAPLAAAGAAVRPSTPAKPSPQAKAQKPAPQAQAPRPATTQAQVQAQVQRPVVASAPASTAAAVAMPVQVAGTKAAPRHAAVAAAVLRTVKAERPVARSMNPVSADPLRLARSGAVDPIERLGAVDGGQPPSAPLGTLLLALLALGGMGVAVALVAVRRRMARDMRDAALALPLHDEMDAAAEAELQEMILQTRARMMRVADGLEDGDDAPAVSATQ